MPEFTKEKLAELREHFEMRAGLRSDGHAADVLALITALEAKTAEADYWQDSWNREDGYRIDAERERDKARAEVESITSQWRATGRAEADAHRRAEKAEAALERVREAATEVANQGNNYSRTHYEGCWKHHLHCLAAKIIHETGAGNDRADDPVA